MTTILATDTSTAVSAVALWRDGAVLAETLSECGRRHSERLLIAVRWAFEEARLELRDVDALAVSIGPGSFTGLRIGVAAWKGLALGMDRPLIAVPTLDAMTRLGLFHDVTVCPLLDARMGEVYGAIYRFAGTEREKLTPDRVCAVETLLDSLPEGPAWFLGDGAALYRERIERRAPQAHFASGPCAVPRASAVAEEAALLWKRGIATDPAQAAPLYLRQSQAEINRALRRREAQTA
ncbi:MAG TPA: tRNA (adenosine(37)-N6)-threonylcarbamoyltransferase complex dimerization subunit type 1 TsaB [Candidatus Hydrogenedentes bacterium]|nr:tRNA (adenosine(37)-N6)-threonylcarbamoyltransferase complex dimerization subunit type 1 TsaB [Candidatus Hydrogenedentota bacterium]HNT87555.1 tRNA (adenosine(37)-N6)-threonylcarbamoyltransferase complex dimerization subunit type 1 TsaB [Candidatus Hydrogenedentota bacterium]